MSTRREVMNYIGTGAIGGIIGFYAGAQELLGIQSEETETAPISKTETPTETPTETEPEMGYVKYNFEDGSLNNWEKLGHNSENEMGLANEGHKSQHSLYLDHNGSINNFAVETSLDNVVSPSTVSFWIQPTQGDQYSKDMFRLRNGETDVIWFTNHRQNDGVYFRFGPGNDEEDRERIRNSAIAPDINRFVEVRLEQISWENGNIGEVYIDNEITATDAPFHNTQSGFDAVTPYSVGGGNSAFRIDDIGWE